MFWINYFQSLFILSGLVAFSILMTRNQDLICIFMPTIFGFTLFWSIRIRLLLGLVNNQWICVLMVYACVWIYFYMFYMGYKQKTCLKVAIIFFILLYVCAVFGCALWMQILWEYLIWNHINYLDFCTNLPWINIGYVLSTIMWLLVAFLIPLDYINS